jgi:hypothetical protein
VEQGHTNSRIGVSHKSEKAPLFFQRKILQGTRQLPRSLPWMIFGFDVGFHRFNSGADSNFLNGLAPEGFQDISLSPDQLIQFRSARGHKDKNSVGMS